VATWRPITTSCSGPWRSTSGDTASNR
jgi:hypothetical protein